jgi:glycerol-3-phosphate dehydrogenase
MIFWDKSWREATWQQLDLPWDVIIIGGGITGAGVLREAVRLGLRTLLVEANDFAYGTSSRSSKLVHGGLRYLKNMQVKTTLESVSERECLLRQGKGLINRLGFLYACFEDDDLPGWVFGLGLAAYDLMARQWSHRAYDTLDMCELCPPLSNPQLRGGYRYFDAQTDDARLVMRVLAEAAQAGGTALNYARVISLLRDRQNQVIGVVLADQSNTTSTRTIELRARAVINATGAWADNLRQPGSSQPRLRPLRGSHLVFSKKRLALTRALGLLHPRNGRPVFFVPWENVVLVGTTDVDHPDLNLEPKISQFEAEYLLESVQFAFPELEITPADVQSTYAGIRPVISTGKADPARESREHAVWLEDGLLTISGGKLTTFRLMARDALRVLRRTFNNLPDLDRSQPVLDPLNPALESNLAETKLSSGAQLRLLGRYAARIPDFLKTIRMSELNTIQNTDVLWAELRWAARFEAPVHLDDILLRRTRLGLLLPQGGQDHLPHIRTILQPELAWDDQKWFEEQQRYQTLYQECYNFPN